MHADGRSIVAGPVRVQMLDPERRMLSILSSCQKNWFSEIRKKVYQLKLGCSALRMSSYTGVVNFQVNVLIWLKFNSNFWMVSQTIVQVAYPAGPKSETQFKPTTLKVLVPPPQPKLGNTSPSDLAIRPSDYMMQAAALSSCAEHEYLPRTTWDRVSRNSGRARRNSLDQHNARVAAVRLPAAALRG